MRKQGAIHPVVRIIFLLMVVCLTIFSCGEPEPFPTELIGRWKTSVPRYQDRFLRITEKEIEFGTGGIESTIFYIESLKRIPKGSSVLWRFNCQMLDSGFFEISMVYDPGEGSAELHMKNLPKVKWYKVQE